MSVVLGPSHYRGHSIVLTGDVWRYESDGVLVSEAPWRACGHCDRPSTPEGHDGCLGTLPGVLNACCGHGDVGDAYVQFDDPKRTRLGGQEALDRMQELMT